MCSKCTLKGGISCVPTSVHSEWAIGSVLKVAFVSELFFRSGVVNSCPENPFRICFDIQLDLHEPVGGCQPNLGLIPALYACGCACVCVSAGTCQLTAVYWRFHGWCRETL